MRDNDWGFILFVTAVVLPVVVIMAGIVIFLVAMDNPQF